MQGPVLIEGSEPSEAQRLSRSVVCVGTGARAPLAKVVNFSKVTLGTMRKLTEVRSCRERPEEALEGEKVPELKVRTGPHGPGSPYPHPNIDANRRAVEKGIPQRVLPLRGSDF